MIIGETVCEQMQGEERLCGVWYGEQGEEKEKEVKRRGGEEEVSSQLGNKY